MKKPRNLAILGTAAALLQGIEVVRLRDVWDGLLLTLFCSLALAAWRDYAQERRAHRL